MVVVSGATVTACPMVANVLLAASCAIGLFAAQLAVNKTFAAVSGNYITMTAQAEAVQ